MQSKKQRQATRRKIEQIPDNGFLLSVHIGTFDDPAAFYLDVTREQALEAFDNGMYADFNEYGVCMINRHPTN